MLIMWLQEIARFIGIILCLSVVVAFAAFGCAMTTRDTSAQQVAHTFVHGLRQ